MVSEAFSPKPRFHKGASQEVCRHRSPQEDYRVVHRQPREESAAADPVSACRKRAHPQGLRGAGSVSGGGGGGRVAGAEAFAKPRTTRTALSLQRRPNGLGFTLAATPGREIGEVS